MSIVDWINGTIDTTTSVCHGPSGMAFQGVGEVTCSLGEVANRGDLIMFWGSNPAESHPRHFTKYSLMPKGMFLPNGRTEETSSTAPAGNPDDFDELRRQVRRPRRRAGACCRR